MPAQCAPKALPTGQPATDHLFARRPSALHRIASLFMAPGIMCFGKKPADPDSRRNEEIEKGIRNDKKRQEREVKLLLLGTQAHRAASATAANPY